MVGYAATYSHFLFESTSEGTHTGSYTTVLSLLSQQQLIAIFCVLLSVLGLFLVPVWKWWLHCSEAVVNNERHNSEAMLLTLTSVRVGVGYITSVPFCLFHRVLSIKRRNGSCLLFTINIYSQQWAGHADSQQSTLSCSRYWNSLAELWSVLLRTNMVNSVLIWSTQGACQTTQIEEHAASLRPCWCSSQLSRQPISISVPFRTVPRRAVCHRVLREGRN